MVWNTPSIVFTDAEMTSSNCTSNGGRETNSPNLTPNLTKVTTMAKTYKASEIDKVVMEELDDFAGACVTDIQEAAADAAKWAVKQLKQTSPKRFGDYAKEWKVEKTKLRTGTHTTVYNKGLYMLSHLLEYGHPTGNGGRTTGKAFIKPVETEANKRFESELKRRVEDDS